MARLGSGNYSSPCVASLRVRDASLRARSDTAPTPPHATPKFRRFSGSAGGLGAIAKAARGRGEKKRGCFTLLGCKDIDTDTDIDRRRRRSIPPPEPGMRRRRCDGQSLTSLPAGRYPRPGAWCGRGLLRGAAGRPRGPAASGPCPLAQAQRGLVRVRVCVPKPDLSSNSLPLAPAHCSLPGSARSDARERVCVLRTEFWISWAAATGLIRLASLNRGLKATAHN